MAQPLWNTEVILGLVLRFFSTDEKIDLQFIDKCQEIAEFVLAAAIKLFPAVAVVTT